MIENNYLLSFTESIAFYSLKTYDGNEDERKVLTTFTYFILTNTNESSCIPVSD